MPVTPHPTPPHPASCPSVNSLEPGWSSLTGLSHLDMSGSVSNGGGLPAEWSTLTALTHLAVSHAGVGGTLPAQWSTLTNLQVCVWGGEVAWCGVGRPCLRAHGRAVAGAG